MACDDCGGNRDSCAYPYIEIDGRIFRRDMKPLPGREGEEPSARCQGCGVLNDGGSVHHYGCPEEPCPNPVCNGEGTMVGCWCLDKCNVCGAGQSRKPVMHPTDGCDGCERKNTVKMMRIHEEERDNRDEEGEDQ